MRTNRNRVRTAALAALTFCLGTSSLPAQEMTGPFHLWMLNNEARMFEILGNDRRLIERLNMPVPMLPGLPLPSPRVEEKLYKIHLGFFRLFPEFNAVFGLARKYGSGRFAKVFEKARPGHPALAGFRGLPAWPVKYLQPVLDKQFQESFFTAQGISKDRDVDLDQRLNASLEGLSDSDRRLLNAYLETFLALYPNNQATRIMAGMARNGVNKDFAKGLAALVGEGTVATGSSDAAGGGASSEAGSSESSATQTSAGTPEPGSISSGPAGAASGAPADPAEGSGTPLGSVGATDPTAAPANPGAGTTGAGGTSTGTGGSDAGGPPEDDPFKIMGN